MKCLAVGGTRTSNALRLCIVLGVWLCLWGIAGCRSVHRGERKQQQSDFHTLLARADLRIYTPQGKEDVWPVEVRMVRDSAILLSLRPLAGIEVARIRLDGNGFLILDRLDRVYAEGDYGLLDSFPNIIIPPFAHIQELLDRRLFVEEEIPLFPKFVALRFSHVQTDVTVDMDVPIPPKYRRISIQELFLLIQQKL